MFWCSCVVWLSAMGCPLTHCVREVFFFPLNILFMRNFSQREGYVAGLNFHKQWGCGWLQLPSETNHLIKKKWADRIDAVHFQCGDMSPQREQQQPVNTEATRLQIKLWQSRLLHLWMTFSRAPVSLRTLWGCRGKELRHRCCWLHF